MDILYNHSSITRTQIALNATCAVFHLNALAKLPMPRSQGSVPIANKAMIIIHIKKFHVLIAYNCIAKVNPQGKKNVSIQLPNVHIYFLNHVDLVSNKSVSFFVNNLPVGRVIDIALNFGEICVRLIHSMIITTHTIRVITDIINGDKLITDPNNHNNHHKIPNQIILPALNQK